MRVLGKAVFTTQPPSRLTNRFFGCQRNLTPISTNKTQVIPFGRPPQLCTTPPRPPSPWGDEKLVSGGPLERGPHWVSSLRRLQTDPSPQPSPRRGEGDDRSLMPTLLENAPAISPSRPTKGEAPAEPGLVSQLATRLAVSTSRRPSNWEGEAPAEPALGRRRGHDGWARFSVDKT